VEFGGHCRPWILASLKGRKEEVDEDAEGVKIFIVNKTEGNDISEQLSTHEMRSNVVKINY